MEPGESCLYLHVTRPVSFDPCCVMKSDVFASFSAGAVKGCVIVP